MPATGVGHAAEHHHQPVALHPGQHVDAGVPGGPLQRRRRICSGWPGGAAPITTATGVIAAQPSADARLSSVSSKSPRSSTSTTSASSRASQAPRISATPAYTCAAAKAISRL